MKNNIFEVDVKGLRELQEDKPKWFIVRELLQNAFDEPITECKIDMQYERGRAFITIEDDSPVGFRDLSDAYTLFKDTYKRSDVKKRGRFNFGEKQVICLCDYAKILSTTGGYEFDLSKGIRRPLRQKRERGSMVHVVVKMTPGEFDTCLLYCQDIIVPKGVKMRLNGYAVAGAEKTPYKTFTATLPTEQKSNGRMRTVNQETEVELYDLPLKYIYEMGIPICEIDCQYGINVQQKVPLSTDRDKVDAKYMKLLYGEVLNHVAKELHEEESSAQWVREGFVSPRATVDARKTVIHERYGDKALIANPTDPRSMDEAISHGYKIVWGAENSKEEWEKIRDASLMTSTSAVFKTDITGGESVTPNEQQKVIAEFSKKVARDMLGIRLHVGFYNSPDSTAIADYSAATSTLRFNTAHVHEIDWLPRNGVVGQRMLDLIIHELGHSNGTHHEHSYHECLTELGAKLTLKALQDPKWFQL